MKAIDCRGVDVLAVTAFAGDEDELAATFEALRRRREAVVAQRRATDRVRELAPLFEKLAVNFLAMLKLAMIRRCFRSLIDTT